MLSRYAVGVVAEPGCGPDPPLQADLDRAITDEHVPVRTPRAGDSFRVGDLRFDVLSPDRCWHGTDSDPNNDSLVLMLTYAGHTVLFGAEPEEPAQQVMLDDGVPLHADVLKVPHHGAATSLPEFFDAVGPGAAVVSVGENPYGHPVASTLAEIAATGARIWRTDLDGTVTVTVGPGGITVSAANG